MWAQRSGTIWSVAFSQDGKFALSGSSDNTLRKSDLESGECVSVLDGHSSHIRSVAISKDGSTAYSAAGNGVLRIWNL
jgi:WD40 repeat protein